MPKTITFQLNFLVRTVDLIYLLLDVTLRIFGIAVAIFVFISPCQLPFLGSLFFSTCSGWSVALILSRFVLALLEYVILTQMVLSGYLYAVFMLLSGIIFLWNESEKAFCSHGNCKRNKFMTKYRQLQVMEKVINSCIRFRIFPLHAMVSPTVQILSCYAIVKLHSSMELSHLVSLLVTAFVSFVFGNLIVFGGAAMIYSKSCGCLVTAKDWHKNHKIHKRVMHSMTPLKCWFGSNYVDFLTPLVIQHFCISQTINLLLLG